MKTHELFKPIDIIDETEKAVKVESLPITEQMEKDANLLHYSGFRIWFKGEPFWLPKSQIEMKDNKVIAVTKWLYNQHLMFIDSPLCLKEDVERVANSYLGKRMVEQERIKSHNNKKED